jgi:hypothetical protein
LHLFTLNLREIEAEKTRSGCWNKNFEVIYEEEVMAHIQNHKKLDIET